jgi:beta-glucosidase
VDTRFLVAWIPLFAALTSSVAGETESAASAAPPAGYRLVWADEFDADGLPDPGRWSYDTMSNRSGWANEERQYYAAARRENSRVEKGVLIIEARHERTRAFEDSGGQHYTSARLVTNGHASWTYGFFEIRAKLPCGRGTWPAIWMLADAPVINWPDIGEIDIMEHVGFDPGVVHGTIHTKAYNHVINTARGDQMTIADACAAFHRYQLTWTPDRIVIGADDKPYFQFDREASGGHDTWPFDAPQYLILNIAVGGTWGGQKGVDDAIFPARMEVDYVRVYQLAQDAGVHPGDWPQVRSRGLVDAATEARIDGLLAKMSLEEKVGQIIQTDISTVVPEDLARYPLGSILAGGNGGPDGNDRATPREWLELSRRFHAAALAARPGGVAIPLIFGIDAVHGHSNMLGAVIFPHNIGLGAAHDPELVRRIGAATAEAVAATGIDWTFAPTLAVPQDVRWGRSYEGFSEDPSIVRDYARTAIEGLQGNPELSGKLQAGRVAATGKSWVGEGGTLDAIDTGDNRASESDLIRIHAQGYFAAIDAGVMTLMASYSSWQGVKMHANRPLLTDILKGRLGFEGFVIGDWDGHARVPGCRSDHCPQAINAGVDMFMAPYHWKELYQNTLADVRSGAIPAARLDDAVRRILRVKLKLGLFEAARPYEGRFELLNSSAAHALAREAVRKSLVLLKNGGVLPIRSSARIFVTGPGADNLPMQCGGWSLTWQTSDTTNADFPAGESIRTAFERALKSSGGRLVDGTDLIGADRPDVAVVVYGEQPYAENHGDVKLAIYNDREMLEQLWQLRHEGIPTVSIVLSGRPLWMNPELEASDAFVAAWLPGTEGGGIADVLIGDAEGRSRFDFSGRLPFHWPNGPYPPNTGHADSGESWPLGYGLSYSTPASP